jgi:hypothetical protein
VGTLPDWRSSARTKRPNGKHDGWAGTEFRGDGFSLTEFGRGWVRIVAQHPPSDPSRFSEVMQPFIGRFGEGFARRAAEASRCYRTTNYLACCVMAGHGPDSADRCSPHCSPATLSRQLGVIKRVTGTYRYYLTRAGRAAIAAGRRLTEQTIIPALA